MTDKAFRQLVREMRDAQKNYFSARSIQNLKTAKALENKVDRALEADEDEAEQEPLL